MKKKKTIFTNEILSVLLHNEDLDLQLGTASHQWEEKGQLTVNVPEKGKFVLDTRTWPLHPPNLQRLADPPLLVIDVTPVAVHVEHLEAVPLEDLRLLHGFVPAD